LGPMPDDIEIAGTKPGVDWNRIFLMLLGVGLFSIVNFSPDWPDAIDPGGKVFSLSTQ